MFYEGLDKAANKVSDDCKPNRHVAAGWEIRPPNSLRYLQRWAKASENSVESELVV